MSYFKYIAIAALVAPGSAHSLEIDPFTEPSTAEVTGGSGDDEQTVSLATSSFNRTNRVVGFGGTSSNEIDDGKWTTVATAGRLVRASRDRKRSIQSRIENGRC